jgi:hypothetical protein
VQFLPAELVGVQMGERLMACVAGPFLLHPHTVQITKIAAIEKPANHVRRIWPAQVRPAAHAVEIFAHPALSQVEAAGNGAWDMPTLWCRRRTSRMWRMNSLSVGISILCDGGK